MAIEASHYEEDRSRLMKDPIVQQMAAEMPRTELAPFLDKDGHPTWQFMSRCNAEYHQRGGTDSAHIGGIAQAIVRLKEEED